MGKKFINAVSVFLLFVLLVPAQGIARGEGVFQSGGEGDFRPAFAQGGPIDPTNFRPDKSGNHPHLDTTLNQLSDLQFAAAANAGANLQSFADGAGLKVEAERVLVTFTMLDESAADAAVQAVSGLGGEVITRYQRWFDAYVPVSALEQAASLSGVSLVHKPYPVLLLEDVEPLPVQPRPDLQSGEVVTAGVAASNADAWHEAGFTGEGIEVAVLDSFANFSAVQAAGELPADVAYYPSLEDLDQYSPHGTNVAEIIYDMAPGESMTLGSVEFSFDTDTCTSMALRIVELAENGADIISSSVGPLRCGSGDCDPRSDPIGAAAEQALEKEDTLYFQAAGNHAEKHWDGYYQAFAESTFHGFADGTFVNELGALQAGTPLAAFLRWNDWPASDNDYDLYLVRKDATGEWVEVASSVIEQTGTQPPVEGLAGTVLQPGTYGIAILNYAATGDHVLDLMVDGPVDLQYGVGERSLVGPATSKAVFGVGAVDVHDPFPLETYSSQGPSHGRGGSLERGNKQPQISGYANVDTWIGLNSTPPYQFNGTSSATPHVAGAAALLWGANPCLSATQLAGFLLDRAEDHGEPGYDYQYGYGSVYLGEPTDKLCKMEDHVYLPGVTN